MKDRKRLPDKAERHRLFGSVTPGVKTKPQEKDQMADLQNTRKDFLFDIQTVGIANVLYPMPLKSALQPEVQHSTATFAFSSSIPFDSKGTNMSRFTEQLELYR
ncbi:MAG: GTP cyclohydrolase, FolE2/MptA family, partial [Bacilli bacterium]